MKCGLIRYLSNDVSELMDVGDTRAKLFAKLGIRKFKDLLFLIWLTDFYNSLIFFFEKLNLF